MNDESAQGTIEDKLNNIKLHKILNRVFVPNPDWKKNKVALKRREFRMRQIKDLQAIITTETTNARIAEAELIGRYFSAGGVPEFIEARLNALQKEQNQ